MAPAKKRAWMGCVAVLIASCVVSCSGDDGASASDGPDPDSGVDGGGTGDGDGDGDGIVGLERVPATFHGFYTLGEPRGGDDITLSGDGFELGERRCTANGLFCITGGFEP